MAQPFDSGNTNQKVIPQPSSTAPEPNATSLTTQVIDDLVTGKLRFVLFGKSDSVIEVWRAASPSPSQPSPQQTPAVTQVEPLVCDAATACKILGGIGSTSLWELEKRGIIKQLPGFPRGKYSIAHLRQVVARQTKKQITKWE